MFANPVVAKHVLDVFLSTNGQMNECIEAVAKEASPEELNAFKREVGRIVFEVFENIIEPVCKRHPSLKPAEMED